MLKIGQNRGKIANYSPNAQQRSASLVPNIGEVQQKSEPSERGAPCTVRLR